jgi:hypothetical protein
VSRERVRHRPSPDVALKQIDQSLDAVAECGYYSYMACGRKVRYRNKATAMRVAKKRIADGVPYLRVYYCPHCGGWHLTKKESWEA